jgi:serine/threonine protein kinase
MGSASDGQSPAPDHYGPVSHGSPDAADTAPAAHYGSFDSVSESKPANAEDYGAIPRSAREAGAVYQGIKKAADVVSASDLLWGAELGRGAFGVVYDALWTDPRHDGKQRRVAVKLMTEFSQEALADFEKEANTMRSIKPHPNVVMLLGICHDPYSLVTEFMEQGSLDRWLKAHPDVDDKGGLRRIVREIIAGVAHLHAQPLIHRDLAARNVLVAASGQVKIADFGQARQDTGDQNKTKSDSGPLKWMAPECILRQTYSVKTDTFSFGITLVEIYTRALPYPGLPSMRVATQVAAGTLTHPTPKEIPKNLRPVFQACLSFEPADRPDFEQLKDMV